MLEDKTIESRARKGVKEHPVIRPYDPRVELFQSSSAGPVTRFYLGWRVAEANLDGTSRFHTAYIGGKVWLPGDFDEKEKRAAEAERRSDSGRALTAVRAILLERDKEEARKLFTAGRPLDEIAERIARDESTIRHWTKGPAPERRGN